MMQAFTALMYVICIPMLIVIVAIGVIVLSLALRALIAIIHGIAHLISVIRKNRRYAKGKLVYRGEDGTEVRYYG